MSESTRAGTRSRIRSWILWGVLLGSAALSLAAVKSYGDLRAARGREQALSQRIDRTHEKIGELSDRIRRLRDDPTELERLARQELGLVKPGDVVILLPQRTGNSERSPQASAPRAAGASRTQSPPR